MKAIKIPHDRPQQIEIIEVRHAWQAMAEAIGGGCEYIEEVKCELTPKYGWVMVVDEDGLGRGQQQNPRAQLLYPFSPIVGDVLICNSGWVADGRDFVDFENAEEALAAVKKEVGL